MTVTKKGLKNLESFLYPEPGRSSRLSFEFVKPEYWNPKREEIKALIMDLYNYPQLPSALSCTSEI